jgi:acetyl/propionyl-CoA carboxylase alpha subunit
MSNLSVKIGGRTFLIEIEAQGDSGAEYIARIEGEEIPVSLPHPDAPVEQIDWIVVGGRPYEIVFDPDLRWIKTGTGRYSIEVRDLEATSTPPVSKDGRVKAPIPGLIRRVLVEPGDRVEIGQTLLILEAMKMENEIRAPRSGTVRAVHTGPGEDVSYNQVLVEVE